MFSANNDFFNRVALRHTDHVSSTSLFYNGAYFAMEPFMRHTLLYARIHLYYHLRTRLVFLKYFANVWLAFFSELAFSADCEYQCNILLNLSSNFHLFLIIHYYF